MFYTLIKQYWYYTDTPLTADQGTRLNQMLLEAYPKDQRHKSIKLNSFYDDLIEQSSAFLSPPQISAFKQMLVGKGLWEPSEAQAGEAAKQSNANSNAEKPQ